MKCEPFRLKPTAPKQRRCNPHQCLTYCMQHTDLDDRDQYPGMLGESIREGYCGEEAE